MRGWGGGGYDNRSRSFSSIQHTIFFIWNKHKAVKSFLNMVTKMLGKQMNAVEEDTILRCHSMAVQSKHALPQFWQDKDSFPFATRMLPKTIKTHFTTSRTKSGLLHTQAKQSEPVFVNISGAQESIPRNRFTAYVAWRASSSTKNKVIVPARQAANRFLGSLKGLQIRGCVHTKVREVNVL